MSVEPGAEQFAELEALAGAEGDGPVVMLNLNRYRDRDAYLRYGVVAAGVLDRVGGRILWHSDAKLTVIGEQRDDEVIAVWYPSLAAFKELATDPELLAAREHRLEGLEGAELICCVAGDQAGALSSELQR